MDYRNDFDPVKRQLEGIQLMPTEVNVSVTLTGKDWVGYLWSVFEIVVHSGTIGAIMEQASDENTQESLR